MNTGWVQHLTRLPYRPPLVRASSAPLAFPSLGPLFVFVAPPPFAEYRWTPWEWQRPTLPAWSRADRSNSAPCSALVLCPRGASSAIEDGIGVSSGGRHRFYSLYAQLDGGGMLLRLGTAGFVVKLIPRERSLNETDKSWECRVSTIYRYPPHYSWRMVGSTLDFSGAVLSSCSLASIHRGVV